MYRRRTDQRKKRLQGITLWHPVILLFFMFLLGACANTKNTATISSAEISRGAAAGAVLAAEQSGFSAEKERERFSEEASLSAAGPLLTEASEVQAGSAAEEEAAREYQQALAEKETAATGLTVNEAGNYTSKEEVALYLHLYHKLPSNYITKKEAEAQGWDSKRGNLDEILPGMSIGGSTFGNYEGLLPAADGRKYYECDIDYGGGYRNAKRIIYSSDGLVFYTEDHYKSFEQLY